MSGKTKGSSSFVLVPDHDFRRWISDLGSFKSKHENLHYSAKGKAGGPDKQGDKIFNRDLKCLTISKSELTAKTREQLGERVAKVLKDAKACLDEIDNRTKAKSDVFESEFTMQTIRNHARELKTSAIGFENRDLEDLGTIEIPDTSRQPTAVKDNIALRMKQLLLQLTQYLESRAEIERIFNRLAAFKTIRGGDVSVLQTACEQKFVDLVDVNVIQQMREGIKLAADYGEAWDVRDAIDAAVSGIGKLYSAAQSISDGDVEAILVDDREGSLRASLRVLVKVRPEPPAVRKLVDLLRQLIEMSDKASQLRVSINRSILQTPVDEWLANPNKQFYYAAVAPIANDKSASDKICQKTFATWGTGIDVDKVCTRKSGEAAKLLDGLTNGLQAIAQAVAKNDAGMLEVYDADIVSYMREEISSLQLYSTTGSTYYQSLNGMLKTPKGKQEGNDLVNAFVARKGAPARGAATAIGLAPPLPADAPPAVELQAGAPPADANPAVDAPPAADAPPADVLPKGARTKRTK